MLTTLILAKNNEKTIRRAVESARPLGDVLVGDAGSDDGTAEVAADAGGRVLRIPFRDDYAAAKNTLAEACPQGWVMFLEPWESVATGHAVIVAAAKDPARPYRLQILHGTIMSKEVRMWAASSALRFENPVFECVPEPEGVPLLDATLCGRPAPDGGERERLAAAWRANRPTDPRPHYYHAFSLLGRGRNAEFVAAAENYLFYEAAGRPATMMRYHLATVQLYARAEAGAAARNVLACIAEQPLMAEFWCLLGDVYYAVGKYWKARAFYDNAVALGSRRVRDDPWPLDIPKYSEYPGKMVASCVELEAGVRGYVPLVSGPRPVR